MLESVLDVALVIFFLIAMVRGWKAGMLVGGLSVVGLLGGTVAGMWCGPLLAQSVGVLHASELSRSLTVLASIIVLATLLQYAFSWLGYKLRASTTNKTAHRIDNALGALSALLATCVAVWGVGVTLRTVVPKQWAYEMNRSQVLTTLDRAMPDDAARWLAQATRVLTDDVFPRVFSGLAPEPNLPVDAPDPGAGQSAGVQKALKSVVKVSADATLACGRSAEGSGWVSGTERVVTNAHVVAGSDAVRVQVSGVGPKLRAYVVEFDPNLDLAVLLVPGLSAAPLGRAVGLERGDSAVVAGFPLGGPLKVVPGRIRGVVEAAGDNIYGDQQARRRVYAVNTQVQHGNSGGPLLTLDGRVAGTVFAKSLVDANTGYVLTQQDTDMAISRGAINQAAVPTGSCTKR